MISRFGTFEEHYNGILFPITIKTLPLNNNDKNLIFSPPRTGF
jgi:hypothetical protein